MSKKRGKTLEANGKLFLSSTRRQIKRICFVFLLSAFVALFAPRSQPPLGGCALAGISSPHPRQRLQDRAVQLCTKQIIYHFVSVYDLRPRGGGLKSAAENRSDSPPLPDVAKTWRRMKAKYKEILMIQSSATVYFLFVKT